MKIGPSPVAVKLRLLRITADLDQLSEQIFTILATARAEIFDLWQRNGDVMAGKAQHPGRFITWRIMNERSFLEPQQDRIWIIGAQKLALLRRHGNGLPAVALRENK